MQLYFRDTYDAENCNEFIRITQEFPHIRFFQPSPIKAPWHVQAILYAEDGEPVELNFWPHRAKGQRRPHPAVEGFSHIRELITSAIKDAADEPFDVFEG